MKSFEEIEVLVAKAKADKTEMSGSSKDVAEYMVVVLNSLSADIEKYIEKGMEAPAKRVRKKFKIFALVAKQFKIKSIKEHKN